MTSEERIARMREAAKDEALAKIAALVGQADVVEGVARLARNLEAVERHRLALLRAVNASRPMIEALAPIDPSAQRALDAIKEALGG